MRNYHIRIIGLQLIAVTLMRLSVFGLPGNQEHPSAAELLKQFKNEQVFWRQFEVAKKIVALHDLSMLQELTGWLNHDDRHLRGNAAFIFAGLGDDRGFKIINAMLNDRSDRPAGQGIAGAASDGRCHVAQQLAADRYYAVHLFGDLKDSRAVPILVPLLRDEEVHYIVPWALGEIGDKHADDPLIKALDDKNPSIRVLAIYALEKLGAKEAVPRLRELLEDNEKSNFGGAVSVAEAAKVATLVIGTSPFMRGRAKARTWQR